MKNHIQKKYPNDRINRVTRERQQKRENQKYVFSMKG